MKKIILVSVLIIATFLVSCRTYNIYVDRSQDVDVIIIQKRKNGLFISRKKVSVDPKTKNDEEIDKEKEEESKERSEWEK